MTIRSKKININDYVVAIPSYNRSNSIYENTLSVLLKYSVPVRKIYIFLANDEELGIYKSVLHKKFHKNMVVGVLGLKNQRNFITHYFPNNTNIVQLDDDVKEISQLVILNKNGKDVKKFKPIKNLPKFFKHAFKLCRKHKTKLWGIYPVYNPFFLNNYYTIDLRFIVGPMWGKINDKSKDLKLSIDEKEDVERTLLHYDKFKSVIRFENISIDTYFYKNKGGMQAENKNRTKEALKSAKYLQKKYPKYGYIYLKKKSGHPEFKLKDKNDKRPLNVKKIPIK
tara:strand:- start:3099 stop:3944 length:846 start_codon:yes stop_codon:yes gene_type:complete